MQTRVSRDVRRSVAGRSLGVGLVVPALVVAATALGASSAAASTFGTRFLQKRSYGSRVSITTPAASNKQSSDEIVLHRALVQSGFSKDVGLVQAGVYRTGSKSQLDSCPLAARAYKEFSEHKAVRSGVKGYKCQLYNSLKPGQTVTYAVYSRGSKNKWSVRFGSHVGGTYPVGFNTGPPMIGGELNGSKPPFTSTTSARYGSASAWDVFGAANLGSARKVAKSDASALLQPTDKGWHVPMAPTPLTIGHS